MTKFKHIELFAGCGGMSLGLKAAGFDLYMANELSPMAAETFAYNILGENLSELSNEKKESQKVIWLSSKYERNNLKQRLRENPFEISSNTFTDISSNFDFREKLIIGNIDDLLKFLAHHKKKCKELRNENIDLLSGGPPCQGFSLAGKREKDDSKNILPLSFARFAGLIKPKIVLLENVKGIISPFTTPDGIKHYSWLELAKAFALEEFYPICMMVNSKYFGVPQNRPRFILIAFRKDIFEKLFLLNKNSKVLSAILINSSQFYKKVRKKRNELNEVTINDIKLFDIEENSELFNGKLFPKIKVLANSFITAKDAINDLSSTKKKYQVKKIKNKYSKLLTKKFIPPDTLNLQEIQNHDHRNHSYKVKARFRLYQVLNSLNGIKQDALEVINGKCTDDETLLIVFNAIKNEPILIESEAVNIFDKAQDIEFFKKYIKNISSRKHSQRAIKANEPAPSQMTIPDDLCHYSLEELRTFTVREMARFQSFPDWFVFRSKVTTGGQQRSFEVPQYTQVGNAVPPMLAYELGKTVSKLLKSIE